MKPDKTDLWKKWAVYPHADGSWLMTEEDFLAALSEAEGERWIPVQEAMPPDTKAVLVWCPERKNTYSANWVVPFWCHFADNGNRKVEQVVTHWQPLPAPPKVKP